MRPRAQAASAGLPSCGLTRFVWSDRDPAILRGPITPLFDASQGFNLAETLDAAGQRSYVSD